MTEPLDVHSSAGALVDFNGASASLESSLVKARNLRISLKQWKMFHAVIDFGGFFGAADSLHVTQSTVSHAVAKLQEQLGIPLLVLKGRKAHITEQGKALLERSRDLVRNAMELEELAENLKHGWGPEIRLALDPSFPHEMLPLALRKLSSLPQKIRQPMKSISWGRGKRSQLGVTRCSASSNNGERPGLCKASERSATRCRGSLG